MGFLDIPQIGFSIGAVRKIDTIQGFITISESSTDTLQITKQPVQKGATISDHAFKEPTLLSMTIQFKPGILSGAETGGSLLDIGSQFVSGLASAAGDIIGAGKGSSASALGKIYKKLLDLQASRLPFTVTTPKRIYKNNLFASLGVTTDKKSENILAVLATFQEVIIVNVSTNKTPRSVQKTPAITGAIEDAGNKSALKTIIDAGKKFIGG